MIEKREHKYFLGWKLIKTVSFIKFYTIMRIFIVSMVLNYGLF